MSGRALPVVERGAVGPREIQAATQQGREDEAIDDRVHHDGVHVVWGDSAVPDPGPRRCVNLPNQKNMIRNPEG